MFSPISSAGTATLATLAILTASNGAVSVPVEIQISESFPCAYFSTALSATPEYNSKDSNLWWWDGDSVMTPDKSNNLLRLVEIGQLPDNWDENHASSFSPELLSIANGIVMKSLIQADIFPTARDSIQFEYENSLGDYLELEVFEGGRIKLFSYSHDGSSVTKDIALSDINKVVGEFYGHDLS